MIYLVTLNQELFENNTYKIISPEESLRILSSWGNMAQADSETTGRDAHICDILCFQIGKCDGSDQIVIDTTTVDIRLYKDYLEKTYLIFQNAKFDLQFLFNYGIIPRKIYDTMIVEQVLYLGYQDVDISKDRYIEQDYDFPYLSYTSKNGYEGRRFSASLHAIAKKRLGIDIDKSIRGEIKWRGLSSEVILYSATDVKHLYRIMISQLSDCKKRQCLKAAELECKFVPVIAYLEWCGIKMDIAKWKKKMEDDKHNLQSAISDLNSFVVKEYDKNPDKFSRFVSINLQGDLWEGFDTNPKCNILWSSSAQVIPFAKTLGFDTSVKDSKTGEDKDSVLEKHLKKQKGINDEFLLLYFGRGDIGDDDYFPGYTGSAKRVSSFGQGHLNAINPKTGRIHSQYKQLRADTSRMSSGSKEPNTDLAKYKKLLPSECKYPNMQQLGSDEVTRSCFVAERGNLWCSCDYAAIELAVC